MALRNIREMGDDILTKECRVVKDIDNKVRVLIDDMLETMYDAQGVGLAAPQIGVLKQIVVIDVSEDCSHPLVLVNPTIIETDGEQDGSEGCRSVPGKIGMVKRPNYVKVEAFDREMKPIDRKSVV